MTRTVEWALMNWLEIREAAERQPVVLVPAGTVETQGPTYVGYEAIFAEKIALDAAGQTGSLVTPTIPFGWSADFEAVPGTISIHPALLSSLYEDVARSIARAGFFHIMFVAAHIPNQPPIEQMAYRLRRELGIQVAWINPGAMATEVWRDIGPDYPVGRGHGADTGRSLAAFIRPDAVDLDAEINNEEQGDYNTLPFGLAFVLEDHAPVSGGFGDANHASLERGELWYGEVLRRVVEAVERYRAVESPRPLDLGMAPMSQEER